MREILDEDISPGTTSINIINSHNCSLGAETSLIKTKKHKYFESLLFVRKDDPHNSK